MAIKVTEVTMVKPARESFQERLWISNMDLVMGSYHMPSVYFYPRPKSTVNFFDAGLLKEALSRALVPFYPMAGRLARDEDGRIEIDCNGEGALFVVAETDSTIEDFGDFAPRMELMQLIPKVEYSGDNLSTYPLLVLQVTHFKCGGVSLGVGIVHKIADGCSGTHFVNSWANEARGLKVPILPFIDRTLLRARDPPVPSFPHVEFHPPPSSMKTAAATATATAVEVFKLTLTQLNQLKSKLNAASPHKTRPYSSYVTIAAHIWRCACIARALPSEQLTKMHCATDGRKRFRPPLPEGYLGNVVFQATPMAAAGEITRDGGATAAEMIRSALARMDDEYLRSALDYIEVLKDFVQVSRGPHNFNCPNIGVTSWVQMPIHDADFGWGKPVYMGPVAILYEGLAFVLPSPRADGSLSVAISLREDHMIRFRELFYDF